MLVAQAAASFSIWTGRDEEEARSVMMEAALEKLGKQ